MLAIDATTQWDGLSLISKRLYIVASSWQCVSRSRLVNVQNFVLSTFTLCTFAFSSDANQPSLVSVCRKLCDRSTFWRLTFPTKASLGISITVVRKIENLEITEPGKRHRVISAGCYDRAKCDIRTVSSKSCKGSTMIEFSPRSTCSRFLQPLSVSLKKSQHHAAEKQLAQMCVLLAGVVSEVAAKPSGALKSIRIHAGCREDRARPGSCDVLTGGFFEIVGTQIQHRDRVASPDVVAFRLFRWLLLPQALQICRVRAREFA